MRIDLKPDAELVLAVDVGDGGAAYEFKVKFESDENGVVIVVDNGQTFPHSVEEAGDGVAKLRMWA